MIQSYPNFLIEHRFINDPQTTHAT